MSLLGRFFKKKETLPTKYQDAVKRVLLDIVDTYRSLDSRLVAAYQHILERPSEVLVTSRGLSTPDISISFLRPKESHTFHDVKYQAEDGNLMILVFQKEAREPYVSVTCGFPAERELSTYSCMHLAPAKIIQDFCINHGRAFPIKKQDLSLLDRVLEDLIREDPKLADRLLGYPDQAVQDIALRHLQAS